MLMKSLIYHFSFSTALKKALIIGASTAFFVACTAPPPETKAESEEKPVKLDRSRVFIMDLINQFPGSLETAVMIHATGQEMQYTYAKGGSVNPKDNFSKAVNLGACITRFFFCNLDDNTQGLNAENENIRKLAEDLKISLAYKADEIMDSQDDLQLQRAAFSHEMMIYLLQEQDREITSIGVVLGDWLESFYWLATHYQASKNEVLKEKIGEQKILIPTIVTLLEQYRDDKKVAVLLESFFQLEKEYESITFEKVFQSPKMEVNDEGQLVFTDNSKTIVTFSKDNIGEILKVIEKMRSQIIEI